MGRRARTETAFDARTFSSQDWLRFGETDTPTEREMFVALTIEEIVRVGQADFDPKNLGARLGLSGLAFKQHFDSRDALIAEAIVVAYRKACYELRARLASGPRDAEKRIAVWVEGELEWHRRLKGFSVLANFPVASAGVQRLLTEKHGDEMKKNFEFYAAMVAVLVADLRNGTLSDFDFDADNAPSVQLLKRPFVTVATASIMWSMLGLALWSSGAHIPSLKSHSASFSEDYAIRAHIKNIITVARGDAPPR
jgi:AcrR family transcriptional regulator